MPNVRGKKIGALQGNLAGLNMAAMLGGGRPPPRGVPMMGMSLGGEGIRPASVQVQGERIMIMREMRWSNVHTFVLKRDCASKN